MFVFLVSTVIILAEIVSDGVGTFLLYNLLTGIPLSSNTMKGFSGKVLSGMFYKRPFLISRLFLNMDAPRPLSIIFPSLTL
jgi:hypothetical protein